jgi:flagellar basal body rod protein FlgC
MNGIMPIALSGVRAASRRMAASAGNVASARVTGPRSAAEIGVASAAYQPKRANNVSLPGGGVRAEIAAVEPGAEAVFDPNAPSDEGAQTPQSGSGVDLAAEFVEILLAETAYKAGLKMIEAESQMQKVLPDTRS